MLSGASTACHDDPLRSSRKGKLPENQKTFMILFETTKVGVGSKIGRRICHLICSKIEEMDSDYFNQKFLSTVGEKMRT